MHTQCISDSNRVDQDTCETTIFNFNVLLFLPTSQCDIFYVNEQTQLDDL